MAMRHKRISGAAGAGHYRVLGTRIDPVDMPRAIARVTHLIEKQIPSYVIFCTASTTLHARDDARVREAVEGATLIAPDGMPLVWLGRLAGCDVDRVYGPDFVASFMRATAGSFNHFLYGSDPETLQRLTEALRRSFPSLRIVGSAAPPMGIDPTSPAHGDVEAINASGADVVWVGLGHPRQELWMHTNRAALRPPILAGVGAAFDYLAGTKKEAPGWIQRLGLQWLHRVVREPRRLWRRYLIGNTRFLFLVAKEMFGSRGLREP